MSNVREVKIMQVVRVTAYNGEGTQENPGRLIVGYYDLDGNLLVELDPCKEFNEVK